MHSFGLSAVCVVCERGREIDTHVAIAAAGIVIDTPQAIGGVA
jgi:hypothetical protein